MVDNRIEALFQNEGELTTREKILDVAIDSIARRGFEAVSIRDIAREVGIRESSIYNHFKSKDEILDTIIEYFMAELSRRDPFEEQPIEAILAKYGPEGFMSMGARAYLTKLNKPRIARIWRIISIELYRNEKINKFFRETMVQLPVTIWDQTFKRMIELGYIRECDTGVLAREFFYYCVYLIFDYFVINFNDETYCRFTEDMLEDLAPHIRFLFDAVKAKGD
jgi:AcrR family transcriptional regulator